MNSKVEILLGFVEIYNIHSLTVNKCLEKTFFINLILGH